MLSFVAAAGPHPQWGDVATWVTGAVALGALVGAVFAYRKQADAGEDLAKQVKLQRKQLADQLEATGKLSDQVELQRGQLEDQQKATGKLSDQVEIQREQLEDQQKANRLQAKVLQAQLDDLEQRAAAFERQQAAAVSVAASRFDVAPMSFVEQVLGTGAGRVPVAVVYNESDRPIRNVEARIQPSLRRRKTGRGRWQTGRSAAQPCGEGCRPRHWPRGAPQRGPHGTICGLAAPVRKKRR